MNKKAISPVVAISLLLVVSVVAVVSFQNWYSGFQSGILIDTEQKSSSDSVNIEFISSDGQIYITNTGSSNVFLSTIKIGNADCNLNYNLTPGVNNISVVSCLNESGANNIILVTDKGIVEEEIFVEDIILEEILPSCVNISNGLVGLWHFDNDANDYSGNNRHMTLYNGLTYSSLGQMGDALGFDGVSDYTGISTVNMDSDSWAVSWWMKRTENDYETIFMSISTVSNAIGVDGYPGTATQNDRFSFESKDNNRFMYGPYANKAISDGIWHHISLVFNSTGSFLFVDGVIDDEVGARNHDAQVWDFQYVGRGQGGAYGAYFKGYLDDITLWNRPLTSLEISEIYNYGELGIPICDS